MLKMIYPERRGRLHPKLSILDEIDSRLWFDKNERFFLVEFNRDEDKRPNVVYKHSLLSKDPIYINSVIQDYIQNDWNEPLDLLDDCLKD